MPRNFPNFLRAYAEYTSDSESPNSFHFWTGVATVAGALRRRVWIDMRKFQWTPNFYVILVAPAGVTAKSTSIGMGYRLLSKVEGIHFGPESLTWQALAESLAEAAEGVKYTSAEGKEFIKAQSAVTIYAGELGTFLTMDDDKFVSVLIRMWEGQEDSFKHRTKTGGTVDITNPWLNVIGCTTPTWLGANFSERMIGGGLTSRIIFVFGESKRQLVPYPDEQTKAADYADFERRLVEDLREISKLSGAFILSPAAREWGRKWYMHLWTAPRPSHMASDRYSGYIARKQTHIHKLALVMAAARRSQLLIEEEDLAEAEMHVTAVEPDMIKVFESLGFAPEAQQTRELVAFVRTHGWLTEDSLWKLCMNTMPQRFFTEALSGALRGGLLTVESRNGVRGLVHSTANLTVGAFNIKAL